jgi:hypothetical protein
MRMDRMLLAVPIVAGALATGTAFAHPAGAVRTVRDAVYPSCQHNGVHFNKAGHANCGLHKGWGGGSTGGGATSAGDTSTADSGSGGPATHGHHGGGSHKGGAAPTHGRHSNGAGAQHGHGAAGHHGHGAKARHGKKG